MQITGIDVGGSGIKGALVDTDTGAFVGERTRLATPRPATPEAVAATLAEVARACGGDGPVGVGFPAVVRTGVAETAANIDPSFVGTDLNALFGERLGRPVVVVNDADAAGLAEARLGAARGRSGTVLVITVGTGLGTALVVDGTLVPNTELGHVLLHGDTVERYAADAVRKREDLSWPAWAGRFSEVLRHLDFVLRPTLIVVGGGAAKKWDKYAEHLRVDCEVVPAVLRNQAGIIGAALSAQARAGG